jgi:colicin import membrane protein
MNATIEQGLIVIPAPDRAMAIFTSENGKDLEPFLEIIRKEIDGFVMPDLSKKKGRDEVKSFAYRIVQSKTALEKVGKALADEAKSIPKKIDASRRKINDTLERWHEEFRKPLTDWEDAEKARIERHTAAIGHMNFLTSPTNEIGQPYTAATLRECLAHVEAVAIGPHCEEFEAEYARHKDHAIAALKETIAKRETFEAEQAELIRLRQEAADRAAKDREEAIRKEAAEKAERAAAAKIAQGIADARAMAEEAERAAQRQREAIEAKANAEREAAERRELELRLQAEAAERRAAETEARIKREAAQKSADEAAETARREADRAHKGAVNRSAVNAFVGGGIEESAAKAVVALIAKRSIPAVTIAY